MGLAVDTQACFTNHKNIYKPRFEKRQRKLLEKLSCLSQFLDKGENILLVAPGCSPITLFEQLFTGWIIFYLKRCLFVFTNKRVLHIPTKYDLSFRHSIAQICYADCLSLAVKGSKLIAKYANGKTEKFSSIPSGDRKKITSILQTAAFDGPQNALPQRTHLCPKCTSPLVENIFTCPACGLEFKNRQKARLYSLVFPGGGYFYTRHPFLGISDACAETYCSVKIKYSH